MTPHQIIESIRGSGGAIRPNGDGTLYVDATPDMRTHIVRHKAEILSILSADTKPSTPEPTKPTPDHDPVLAPIEAFTSDMSVEEQSRLLGEYADRVRLCSKGTKVLYRGKAIEILGGKNITSPAKLIDSFIGDEPGADPNAESTTGFLQDPEPWPDSVDGTVLLDDIRSSFRRYLTLSPNYDVALTLWSMHAHCHDAAQISPILTLTSPVKRCGKTTALMILGRLCPRPLLVANVTTATLFRLTDKFRPTILADEADTYLAENPELRGIFNAGYTRGGRVPRCVGDENDVRLFNAWAPKALAAIGRVPDTIEDRAIEVKMQRRPPNHKAPRLRVDRDSDKSDIQRLCIRWAHEHQESLVDRDPEIPASLHDRQADNWRPLLAVADEVGGEWPELARRAAVAISSEAEESSYGEQLLADIKAHFGKRGTDRIFSRDLCGALADLDDRRWAEWSKGKPITQNALGRILRDFKIRSQTVRVGDETAKGYKAEQFVEAWNRYLSGPTPPPQPSQPSQSAPQAAETAFSNRHTDSKCDGCKSASSPHHKPTVTDVTVEMPPLGWKDTNPANVERLFL